MRIKIVSGILHSLDCYFRWVDEKNYIDLTRPWYARILPFPLNYYYPGRNKRENEKLFHSLHPDKEGKEIEHEVIMLEKLECLKIFCLYCILIFLQHPFIPCSVLTSKYLFFVLIGL